MVEALSLRQGAHLLSSCDDVRMGDRLQDEAVMRLAEENQVIIDALAKHVAESYPGDAKLAFLADRLAKNNAKLDVLEQQDVRRHAFWDSFCSLIQRMLKG